MPHRFAFLNPGHFHAALVVRDSSPQIDDVLNVYAPSDAERDAFSQLIDAFNRRAERPTRWRLGYEDGGIEALIEKRGGDVVVLAGTNHNKLEHIARLVEHGFHVLADKPWLTDSAQLPLLARALGGPGIVMDIMTIRHEILMRLCHAVVNTQSVFGGFDAEAAPAMTLRSVHHLYKRVNMQPLRRPVWYYDHRIQGDGMVDVQSHMVEQAMWLVLDDAAVQSGDVALTAARRWSTPVDEALYRDSTGAASFPQALAGDIDGGVLNYPCNGEICWSLRGVAVNQTAEWRPREPEGGGDLHHVRLAGRRADILVEQGEHTGYQAEVSIVANRHEDQLSVRNRAYAALAGWRQRLPGISLQDVEYGVKFTAPAALDQGHESHFPLVRDRFLAMIATGEQDQAVRSRIAARYELIAAARDMALAEETNP